MQPPSHRLSIFARPPANATFVAYFLGAVLPLLGLGIVLDRLLLEPLGAAGPESLSLGRLPALLAFASMSGLSLSCFFMLRRVLKQTLGQHRMLTSFDAVTGLPNRRLFKSRLEQALRRRLPKCQSLNDLGHCSVACGIEILRGHGDVPTDVRASHESVGLSLQHGGG